jgi:hypothetical protein
VSSYLDTIHIKQSDIKLDSEAVQYKITFTQQTMVSFDADISFTLNEKMPIFYVIHFTNGKETYALHLSGDGKGKIDFKVLNRNIHLFKTNIQKNISLSEQIDVKQHSVWYLSIVVAHSIDNEQVSVLFKTISECMTIQLYQHTQDVYLFSTSHHFFDEQHLFKKGILFNIFDGYKQFPISKAGMICVDANNHMYGELTVGNNLYFVKNYNKQQSSVLWTTRYGIRDDTDLKYWYVGVNTMGLFSVSVVALVVDMYFHSEYIFNDCKNKEDRFIENRIINRNEQIKEKTEFFKSKLDENIDVLQLKLQEFLMKRAGICAKRIALFVNGMIHVLKFFINTSLFIMEEVAYVLCFILIYLVRWAIANIKSI